MPISRKIACLSVVSVMLAACGPDGYYDNRGHFHPTTEKTSNNNTNNTFTNNNGNPSYIGNNYYTNNAARKGSTDGVMGYDRERDNSVRDYDGEGDATIVYKRTGYYDYEGTYYPINSGPKVPRSYFPPRGMCRVWLPGVTPKEQPAIESCKGIQTRVPDGAYVVYGG